MQLSIIAFPTSPITLNVIDKDLEECIYYKTTWFDGIVREVLKINFDYNIDEIVICGPIDYTKKIKEQLDEYYENVILKEGNI